tara:strand:- start:837 stop:1244 length:408 start_codon:yes stop_codon:yes gene_type:complete
MSRLNKTKREFLRENEITGMFTRDQIKVLERHDTEDDPYSSSNFPWGCSNSLKLFLVEKGDSYIEKQNTLAKERRKEYAHRTFDKIVRELNTISTKSDLKNWGNTFAKEYVRDIPEFRDELGQEYKRKLSELGNT